MHHLGPECVYVCFAASSYTQDAVLGLALSHVAFEAMRPIYATVQQDKDLCCSRLNHYLSRSPQLVSTNVSAQRHS
jgi:hypothetical protein